MFAEINDPQAPQFRAAKSILAMLEKLTYQKFRGLEELDGMASRLESEEGGSF